MNPRSTTKKLIKSTLMRMSETKAVNAVTAYTDIKHNYPLGAPLVTSQPGHGVDHHSYNLCYSVQGADGNNRVGDSVYAQSVDFCLNYNFPEGRTESTTNANAWSPVTNVRLVFYQVDYGKYAAVTAAQLEDRLFKHPHFYTSADPKLFNRMTALLNTVDFTILKDVRFEVHSPVGGIIADATDTDTLSFILPKSGSYRTTLPLNKTLNYASSAVGSPSPTIPSKMIGCAVVAYNNGHFGSTGVDGDILGKINMEWLYKYKDL